MSLPDGNSNRKRVLVLGALGAVCAIGAFHLYQARKARAKSIESKSVLSPAQIDSILKISSRLKARKLSGELSSYFFDEFKAEQFYIEYRRFLSNHVSHGLIALQFLGANKEFIKGWLEWYRREKLQSVETFEKQSAVSLKPDLCQWKDCENKYLGKRENFYGIYQMMQRDLRTIYNNDVAKLIRDRFPLLSSGISGSAFHGHIHLGYALSVNNTHLILEGLSYLTHSFLSFKHCPSQSPPDSDSNPQKTASALDVLRLVKKERKIERCFLSNYKNEEFSNLSQGSFQNQVIPLSVYAQGIISDYVALIAPNIPRISGENDSERDLFALKKWLLSTALSLYAYGGADARNDFFLVHGVTAAWSLTQVLPLLRAKDANRAVLEYMNAAIATYFVQGCPEIVIGEDDGDNDEGYRAKIAALVGDAVPIAGVAKNDNVGTFSDEHVYKVIQVALECFESGIIDAACAFRVVSKAQKPFFFIHKIEEKVRMGEL